MDLCPSYANTDTLVRISVSNIFIAVRWMLQTCTEEMVAKTLSYGSNHDKISFFPSLQSIETLVFNFNQNNRRENDGKAALPLNILYHERHLPIVKTTKTKTKSSVSSWTSSHEKNKSTLNLNLRHMWDYGEFPDVKIEEKRKRGI